MGGVLGVEPGLHGVPRRGGRPGGGQRLALRGPQLEGDQVETEHRFRDRVFDLEAGVHLQEVRASLGGDQELHGPRAPVADRPCGGDGGVVEPGAQLLAEAGRGGLLDDLLVTALEGAVAGAECPDGAVVVGHHLHLDVPAALHVGLGEHLAVPERGHRLGGRRRQLGGERRQVPYDPHPASAAARRRLEQQRQVRLGGGGGIDGGEQRHVGGGHQLLGAGLRRHLLDRLDGRTDPEQPRVLDSCGEGGVLGEEAVPGVDRVGPRRERGGDDEVTAEVGVGGRGARQPYGEVGLAHVQGSGVRVRVHGDGGDAERPAGAEDPAGDLAPVGDEQGGDHVSPHIRKMPKPPRAPSTGAVWIAERHIPRTVLVSRGSMTPSS